MDLMVKICPDFFGGESYSENIKQQATAGKRLHQQVNRKSHAPFSNAEEKGNKKASFIIKHWSVVGNQHAVDCLNYSLKYKSVSAL
jgi:hypothetical protein